jgi:hypothetical protein
MLETMSIGGAVCIEVIGDMIGEVAERDAYSGCDFEGEV